MTAGKIISGVAITFGLVSVALGLFVVKGKFKLILIIVGALLALGGIIGFVSQSSIVDSKGQVRDVAYTQEGVGRSSQLVVSSSGKAEAAKVMYTVIPIHAGVASWDRGLADSIADDIQVRMEGYKKSYANCSEAKTDFEKARKETREARIKAKPGLRGIITILANTKMSLSCS